MTDMDALLMIEPELRPLLLEGNSQAVGALVTAWAGSGLTVRVLRGGKMRSLAGVFDEFAAALQFPLYFGGNKDAFDECMADLEGLPVGKGYVLVITEPGEVLINAAHTDLVWFVDSLKAAAIAWARVIQLGEWWDRPSVPFHVVLAGEREDLKAAVRHWSAAGLEPTSFHRSVNEPEL